MKLKLPDNFGGITVDGVEVPLKPNKKGVINAEEGSAQLLLTHGAVPVDGVDSDEA